MRLCSNPSPAASRGRVASRSEAGWGINFNRSKSRCRDTSRFGPAGDSSSQWTKAAVLKHLREKGRLGEPVSAQVFLNDDIDADDVSAAVERIVSDVKKAARASGLPLRVGKIHQLAKSFSVKADPEAIAAITDLPTVKTVLPAELDDIYPKPVKVKRV